MDRYILFLINGCDNKFMDHIMISLSSTATWMLMLLVTIYIISKDRQISQSLPMLFGIALCILFADQITSTLIKPYFQRLRPSLEPDIMYSLRVVAGRGGGYSFPSSHAANVFAIATYLSLIFRHRITTISLYVWATLVGISRIYLAMHYPSDVLCGALIGIGMGAAVYYIGTYIVKRYCPTSHKFYSSAFTRSGFATTDMYLLLATMSITLLWIVF